MSRTLRADLILGLKDQLSGPLKTVGQALRGTTAALRTQQKQLLALNQLAQKIEGHKKLRADLRAVRNEMRAAQDRVASLRQAYEQLSAAGGKGAAKLKTELKQATAQAERLAEGVEKAKQELKASGRALKAQGVAIRNLSSEWDRVNRAAGRVTATIEKQQRLLAMRDRIGARGQDMRARGAAIATSGIPLKIGALSIFRESVATSEAANYFRAVTRRADGSRITAADRDAMRVLATKSAAIRPVSPSQVMGVMKQLGAAGLNLDQVKGTYETAVDLAIAGQLNDRAEEVADWLTNIMTALKMPMGSFKEAQESARRAADAMAFAAGQSPAKLKDIAESSKYAAPMMAMLDESVEKQMSLLAMMAQVGIKGPEAGTAIRSMIVRLSRLSNPGAAALAELGMDYTDYIKTRGTPSGQLVHDVMRTHGIELSKKTRQAIDEITRRPGLSGEEMIQAVVEAVMEATGDHSAEAADKYTHTIRNAFLADIDEIRLFDFFSELRKRGAGINQLSRLFGMRQISRLGNIDGDKWRLIEADMIKNAPGAARRMAAEMMQGESGAWHRLISAWHSLGQAIMSSGVADTLIEILNGMAAALNKMAKTSPGLLKWLTYFAAGIMVLGPLLMGLGTVLLVLRSALSGIALVTGIARLAKTAAITAATLAGGGAAAGASGAGAAGAAAAGAAGSAAAARGGRLAGTLARLARPLMWLARIPGILAGIASAAAAAVAAFNPVTLAIAAIAAALVAAGWLIYRNWDMVKSMALRLASAAGQLFERLKEIIGNVAKWLGSGIKKAAKGVASGIKNAAKGAWQGTWGWVKSRFRWPTPEEKARAEALASQEKRLAIAEKLMSPGGGMGIFYDFYTPAEKLKQAERARELGLSEELIQALLKESRKRAEIARQEYEIQRYSAQARTLKSVVGDVETRRHEIGIKLLAPLSITLRYPDGAMAGKLAITAKQKNLTIAPGDKKASGGWLKPGVPTLVGERGPELILPGRGFVVNNAILRRMTAPAMAAALAGGVMMPAHTLPGQGTRGGSISVAAPQVMVQITMPQGADAGQMIEAVKTRLGDELRDAFHGAIADTGIA